MITLKVLETLSKEIEASDEQGPYIKTKVIRKDAPTILSCEAHDITATKELLNTRGFPYKNKCIVQHTSLGPFIVGHKKAYVDNLIKRLEIKGFRSSQ